MSDPFGTFKTSSQIIRLGVMLYVRFLLSYRNAEILFHKLAAYVGYWQILLIESPSRKLGEDS